MPELASLKEAVCISLSLIQCRPLNIYHLPKEKTIILGNYFWNKQNNIMLVKVKHFIQFIKKQTKEKTKKENYFNSNKNISGNSFFFIGVTKPNKSGR